MPSPPSLPRELRLACRRHHHPLTPHVITVSVSRQQLTWWLTTPPDPQSHHRHRLLRASTSKFGIGQVQDSNRTPLGLHRVAAKIGAGWPIGTVFQSRQPVGLTWRGRPDATIAHRILWLEGLEPGFNRGGNVDTFRRYIYIHGLANEPSLGRPASHGCVHLAASDLIPLFDLVPTGTLVWIAP